MAPANRPRPSPTQGLAVLHPGPPAHPYPSADHGELRYHPREEIIYNTRQNHYFVTSMTVDGTSSLKHVRVAGRDFPVSNGRTLGKAPLKVLTTFSKYRDGRRDTPVSANRELQFLRAIFSWGIEYGHTDVNPAKGVRLFPSRGGGSLH